MPKQLHISGGALARPAAARVIFCDGGVDDTYREGVDLELSHWIPNRTPAAFKADTSTEICVRFVQAGNHEDYDLVVNNHVDVDGVLSTFVLIHPEPALRHRATLIQAAQMGDFGDWGEAAAQRLFQGLICLIDDLRRRGTASHEIYLRCFARTHEVLAGRQFAECEAGLQALNSSVELIDTGAIAREPVSGHFTHYRVPRRLADGNIERALYVPPFNEPLSAKALLHQQARARLDGDGVHLVSVETAAGWYYDLWYPGYTWADTVTRWRPPGVRSTGSSNVHELRHAALDMAVRSLDEASIGRGRWSLARRLSPFAALPGRNFPVVLGFMEDDRSIPSAQTPDDVLGVLAPAFAN